MVNECSTVNAYLETGLCVLKGIIAICKKEVSQGHAFTSWYLNLREEAISYQGKLTSCLQNINGMLHYHMYQNAENYLQELEKMSSEVQQFISSKFIEERGFWDDFHANADEHEGESYDDDSEGDDELLKLGEIF